MKKVYTLTAAACLLGLLTACKSTSSSFTADAAPIANAQTQPTTEAKSEEKKAEETKTEETKVEEPKAEEPKAESPKGEEPKAEEPKADTPATPPVEEPKEEPKIGLQDRTLQLVPSSVGGDAYKPIVQENGIAFYTSGPMDFGDKSDEAKVWQHTELEKRDTGSKIDPNERQTLVVMSSDGKTKLGEFQFVNQTYSTYATFSPELTSPAAGGDPDHPRKNHENLGTYLAETTKWADIEKLNGTITYKGHTLGYVGGPKGDTPSQGYMGDVTLNANFDTKKISGEMSARYDSLVKYHWQFTDDDDNPTAEAIALSQPDVKLILQPTSIAANDNGTVGFRSGAVTVDNLKGIPKRVTTYSGTFAGPNAEEVVGQIGGGEERIMFGATQSK